MQIDTADPNGSGAGLSATDTPVVVNGGEFSLCGAAEGSAVLAQYALTRSPSVKLDRTSFELNSAAQRCAAILALIDTLGSFTPTAEVACTKCVRIEICSLFASCCMRARGGGILSACSGTRAQGARRRALAFAQARHKPAAYSRPPFRFLPPFLPSLSLSLKVQVPQQRRK